LDQTTAMVALTMTTYLVAACLIESLIEIKNQSISITLHMLPDVFHFRQFMNAAILADERLPRELRECTCNATLKFFQRITDRFWFLLVVRKILLERPFVSNSSRSCV